MRAIFCGIIALAVSVILLFGKPFFNLPFYFWDDLLLCLKGVLSSGLVLGGILTLFTGISATKEKSCGENGKKKE